MLHKRFPSPLVDGPVVKVVHVPQVQVVEKTIEIPQLQTIEKIVDIPEIQTLEAVLHEFDDEELCCDDLEERCYMTRMNRKRWWRRVWHGLLISFGCVQNLRGHGEGFRNAYVTRMRSTR